MGLSFSLFHFIIISYPFLQNYNSMINNKLHVFRLARTCMIMIILCYTDVLSNMYNSVSLIRCFCFLIASFAYVISCRLITYRCRSGQDGGQSNREFVSSFSFVKISVIFSARDKSQTMTHTVLIFPLSSLITEARI